MARTMFVQPPGNGSLCETCENCVTRTTRDPGGSVVDDRTERFCTSDVFGGSHGFMGRGRKGVTCPPMVLRCGEYADRNQPRLNGGDAWKIDHVTSDGDVPISQLVLTPPFGAAWKRRDSGAAKARAIEEAEEAKERAEEDDKFEAQEMN